MSMLPAVRVQSMESLDQADVSTFYIRNLLPVHRDKFSDEFEVTPETLNLQFYNSIVYNKAKTSSRRVDIAPSHVLGTKRGTRPEIPIEELYSDHQQLPLYRANFLAHRYHRTIHVTKSLI